MNMIISRDVLMISTMDGLENCAKAVESHVGSRVECAASRKIGLMALRRGIFGVVVVEESLAESDPAWADQVWENLGMAIPLQVNFSVSGAARLTREIRTALSRRDGEQAIARRAATAAVENDFRSSLTGLLLQCELALREPAIPAALLPKLQQLVEMAGAIRERLRP